VAKNVEWHRAMSTAMRRSAAERECPGCGRHGALVEVVTPIVRGQVCRWARDSDRRLCDWDGAWITRAV